MGKGWNVDQNRGSITKSPNRAGGSSREKKAGKRRSLARQGKGELLKSILRIIKGGGGSFSKSPVPKSTKTHLDSKLRKGEIYYKVFDQKDKEGR